ncbi:hypothetical protein [Plantactinospora endophytica]|uniref:Uncharacterized protein n=1 Tax=Plantactinospora endophytica TaxID=673535 RepID=A0ABQ4E854_9ACTN|nr:hypothetical protein [Plantactinospora endophytica]GIG90863.1 hypothetical protein Pen02_57990 [Plantactinospora endophytica]
MSEPWPTGRAAPGDGGADRTIPGPDPTPWPGSPDSPLRGVDYAPAAECLWRWVAAPADAAVRAFLTGYVRQSAAGRRRLRAGLCPDDLYTLLTFARRRALAAIRTGDEAEVLAAFDAFSAIELHRIDWRDVWVSTALASYAAEWLGLAPPETVRAAANRADPELAALLFEVTRDSVDLAEECGYRVLETPTGRVLVDDEGDPYAPTADLAGLAFRAATLLERDNYQVGQVSVAATPPTGWPGADPPESLDVDPTEPLGVDPTEPLGADRAESAVVESAVVEALRGLTGCVCLHAEPDGAGVGAEQQVLLLFLVEAATAEDAATIAGAACRPARDTAGWGLAAGRLCAVLVARSTVSGVRPAEDPASLARFGPRLTAILSTGAVVAD